MWATQIWVIRLQGCVDQIFKKIKNLLNGSDGYRPDLAKCTRIGYEEQKKKKFLASFSTIGSLRRSKIWLTKKKFFFCRWSFCKTTAGHLITRRQIGRWWLGRRWRCFFLEKKTDLAPTTMCPYRIYKFLFFWPFIINDDMTTLHDQPFSHLQIPLDMTTLHPMKSDFSSIRVHTSH